MRLSQLEKITYKANRAAGDYRAATHHRLGRRLLRRAEYRALWRLLRGWGR